MKQLIVILIISSLFYNEAGYFLHFSLQVQEAKRESKKILLSRLKESDYTVIELERNEAAIEWEEEGEEFRLGNELYDIKYTQVRNGRTLLYCLNDKKENIISAKLQSALEKNTSSEHNKHVIKLLTTDYLAISCFQIEQSVFVHTQSFPKYHQLLYSLGQLVNVPPPRC